MAWTAELALLAMDESVSSGGDMKIEPPARFAGSWLEGAVGQTPTSLRLPRTPCPIPQEAGATRWEQRCGCAWTSVGQGGGISGWNECRPGHEWRRASTHFSRAEIPVSPVLVFVTEGLISVLWVVHRPPVWWRLAPMPVQPFSQLFQCHQGISALDNKSIKHLTIVIGCPPQAGGW